MIFFWIDWGCIWSFFKTILNTLEYFLSKTFLEFVFNWTFFYALNSQSLIHIAKTSSFFNKQIKQQAFQPVFARSLLTIWSLGLNHQISKIFSSLLSKKLIATFREFWFPIFDFGCKLFSIYLFFIGTFFVNFMKLLKFSIKSFFKMYFQVISGFNWALDIFFCYGLWKYKIKKTSKMRTKFRGKFNKITYPINLSFMFFLITSVCNHKNIC